MSKRNTVRINMEMLDGYLKAKNLTPKAFCETQLGFSDGWYYSIRKNGGRGVKVLSAQLIARITGIDYKTLVIDEDGAGKNDNPSAAKGGSSLYTREPSAGASPRPTKRVEERGTGNASPTVETEKERAEDGIYISKDDLVNTLLTATVESVTKEFINGVAYAVNNILRANEKRMEEKYNARPGKD